MMFDQREKIAVFIDGANLYATSRTLGFDVDYRKLLEVFNGYGYLLRAYYYTALVEDQEYSSIRPLIDWLDYNGYAVVTKPAKEFIDSAGRRKVKGNMDMELAIDALEIASVADHIVLFSGDGDFRSLVAALQRKGRKVSIVSSIATQPPMVADDLRRQADAFIDLNSLREAVGRPPSMRPSVRGAASGAAGGGTNGGANGGVIRTIRADDDANDDADEGVNEGVNHDMNDRMSDDADGDIRFDDAADAPDDATAREDRATAGGR